MPRYLLLLLILLFTLISRPAWACIAHYRTVEEATADAKIIFVGQITDVTPIPKKQPKPDPEAPQPDTAPAQTHEDDRPQPTIATVQVLRLIKGKLDTKTLKINSGPISSCAPWLEYFPYKKDAIYVFALTAAPVDGVFPIHLNREVMDVNETEQVEAALTRAQLLRTDFLTRMKTDHNKAYEAGLALAQRLAVQSPKWPIPKPPEHPETAGRGIDTVDPDDYAACEKAAQLVVAELEKVDDVESIWVALASLWLSDDNFQNTLVWQLVTQNWEEANGKAKTLPEALRKYYRDELRRQGFDEKYITQYIATLSDKVRVPLKFPIPTPDLRDTKNPDLMTTDFLLRFHHYDRGAMFLAYGMQFKTLANLQPARLKATIPALLGSADEQLQIVGLSAIEYMPGNEFDHLILDRLMTKEWSWRTLVKDKKDDGQRVRAMITQAYKTSSQWEIAEMWRRLAQGECFLPAVLDEALTRLEKFPPDSKEKDPSQRDRLNSYLRDTLHTYLQAAQAARADTKPQPLTPTQYRQWFQSHPEKKPPE